MDGKSITVVDWLLILVTLIGPIAAVQVQKFSERLSDRNERRNTVFRILMATRAVRAGSTEHVQALNLIDLFFNGKGQRDKAVREAWKIYFDELGQRRETARTEEEANARLERSSNLLVDLIYTMSKALRYDFDKIQIKRGAYYPQGHQDEAVDRQIIRQGLVNIANGKTAIPVTVHPVTEEARATSAMFLGALTDALTGNTAIKVSIDGVAKKTRSET